MNPNKGNVALQKSIKIRM